MSLTRRQVLRELIQELKEKYKVDLKSYPLNSVEDCKEALDCIILKTNNDKCYSTAYGLYLKYRAETLFLRTQITELKKKQNKKWWKFWK